MTHVLTCLMPHMLLQYSLQLLEHMIALVGPNPLQLPGTIQC